MLIHKMPKIGHGIYDQNIGYFKDSLVKHSRYNNIYILYSPIQWQGQHKIKEEQSKHRTIWFNPPFSMNVKMDEENIFKTFTASFLNASYGQNIQPHCG